MNLRLAWRLVIGRPGLAWLAVACIAIGVAARGAVNGTVASFEAHLAREARSMLAADLEVGCGREPGAEVRAALAAVLPPGSRTAEARSLTAMASSDSGSLLVDLRAVGPGWPLAGSLRTEPPDAATALAATEPVALVDPDLPERLGVAVGGTLHLGTAAFRIAGTIAADPDAGSVSFRLGPRVCIALASLAPAGLDGNQVRARHILLATLPDPGKGSAIATALRIRLGLPADQAEGMGGPSLPPVTVRSAQEAARQNAHAVAQAADFLRLVALFALALGALGVAALAHGLMRLQAEDLALLRVLGATRLRAAGVFVLQAGGLGACGGIAGTILGAGLAAAAAAALGIAPAPPHPADVALGIGLGILAATIAAVLPALALARMEPLAVLRGEEPPAAPGGIAVLSIVAMAVIAVLAAAWESRSWLTGPAVAGGAAAAAVILALAAWGLLPLLARWRPRGFALRHGLANLARPGRSAGSLVVALGLSAALGTALLSLHAAIAAGLDPGRIATAPAFFAIDVQDDQHGPFVAALAAHGLTPNLRPQVRARLSTINGADVAARPMGASRESERSTHFLRREQNLTWAAEPGPGETLVAGVWPRDGGEAAVEEGWADRVGVRIGSRLAFDVQGVPVAVTITGLRRIDWWTFQPNFFIVLGPGALAGCPPVWMGTIPPVDPALRRELGRELARNFPNVSLIDIGEAATTARRTIDRLALGIAAVAAVALVAALAVVAGTVAAGARERRAESALVRTLGGTRRTVAAAIATEFTTVALAAALLGGGLGLLGGLALCRLLLHVPMAAVWDRTGVLVVVLVAAATVTALLAARRAWRVPPLAVLREE